MRTIGRWTQWKRLLVAAPLSALAVMSAGWSNNLRPLHQGADKKELETDSQYMGRLFAAKGNGGEKGFIDIDLADEAQHRFVLNRLRAAGKSAENAPFLFKRLAEVRQRALARRANPDKSTTASLDSTTPWGCEHYVTLTPGAASGNTRAYKSGPVGSCQGGANYIYVDVLFHNSDLTGTDRVVVDSASGEQYAGGTNFNSVGVNPSMPLSTTRQADVDSMMIAMNDATGEEVLTFLRGQGGSTTDPARVQLQHPSFANPAENKQNISLCQLRGGTDCDYAVVSQSGNTLVPWSSNPTGVAQRLTATPSWTGNSNAFFPFHSGVSFDYQHVFVPVKFGFDAGSGTQPCVISSVHPITRMRLVKNAQGGFCGSNEDIAPFLPVGARTASINRLLNFNRNTTVPASPAANCSMAQITNENVEVSLTVSVVANCGQGPEPRHVTYRSKVDWGWNLYVLNSCMAEGTGIERADGTIAPVESVRIGDKVVANSKGLVLTVTDVQRGGEDKPLVHLRDDKGHDVRLTAEHPLVLASGKVVKAEQVKVKDRVRTRDGVASIVSYERVPYTGQVYNLTLGTPEELAKVSKEDRTMFAGGFQVGDSSMQFDLTAPVMASGDVISRLPAAWHKDFKRRPAVQ